MPDQTRHMRQKRVLALAAPGQRRRAAKDAGCQDGDVEVLSSRILLRPADLGRSRHFYRDVLTGLNRSSQHWLGGPTVGAR